MVITRYKQVLLFLNLLFLISVTGGCIKEKFDSSEFDPTLNLQSGLAIPVGFSHLVFEEYLSDSIHEEELRIGQDGFMSLYYYANIDSGVMKDLLTVNDASIGNPFINNSGSGILLNVPGAFYNLADSLNIPLSTTQTDARIDSIKFLSGFLQMDVTSASLSGTVTFQIDGLQQNGITFSLTRNLSNPDFTVDLTGFSVIPEHDPAGSNYLKCDISVSLQSPSGPISAGGVIFDLRADITRLSYETIYGNFGGYTIDFKGLSIPTPFFNRLTGGQIYFADPKFRLLFSNSAGVPFGIYFRRIDAIDRNNVSHPLTGDGVPQISTPKIIGYPSLTEAGQTIPDSIVINSNNSNLSEFIASGPDSIAILASAGINPLSSGTTTFIRYDSEYSVSASIELPLWGKADFLILLDTMDFDYLNSALPPPEEIERLIVRTSLTNSFPVSAFPQIYLLDENRVLIDSLFTGTEKIEGATDTNGDGKADPRKQDPIDIDLPRSKIDNLMDTRYLLVKGRIMTTDFPAEDVKLYSTYYLDCNIGLIAQLKINTGSR